MTAQIFELKPNRKSPAPARRPKAISKSAAAAAEWMARQPKMFRDEVRTLTTKAPAPFASVRFDGQRSMIVDAKGERATEDLFHQAHGHYVATFMNLHAETADN